MSVRRRTLTAFDKKKPSCTRNSPTVYHAALVIFLEFFAFGLLTTPMISVLNETFPRHTFLMNGLIQGVKGCLSFLSAPLLGFASDVIGRKPFLLATVSMTCMPIPFMKISSWWYFALTSLSGLGSVTFSVALAYVADCTAEDERSWGYGLVSATFAASLVTSPAIGAYLARVYGDSLVVALATMLALTDLGVILLAVPESLSDKTRASTWSMVTNNVSVKTTAATCCSATSPTTSAVTVTKTPSSTPSSSPVASIGSGGGGGLATLRRIPWDRIDPLVVIGFTDSDVALFIALGGIISFISQTAGLSLLNQCCPAKKVILIGLVLEAVQLSLYAVSTNPVILWGACLLAAAGTLTYPALSAFMSSHTPPDQQGVAQGLIAGIRGLCGGLGPAIFGLIFYIFKVDLDQASPVGKSFTTTITPFGAINNSFSSSSYRPAAVILDNKNPVARHLARLQELLFPGPPFAFGSALVLLAIAVACYIPDRRRLYSVNTSSRHHQRNPSDESSSVESGQTSWSTNKIADRFLFSSSQLVDGPSAVISRSSPSGCGGHLVKPPSSIVRSSNKAPSRVGGDSKRLWWPVSASLSRFLDEDKSHLLSTDGSESSDLDNLSSNDLGGAGTSTLLHHTTGGINGGSGRTMSKPIQQQQIRI